MGRRAERGSVRKIYRCLTDCAVQSISHEYSRAFGKGALVDMSESIAEGVTLGELMGDIVKRGLFEPFEEESAPPAVTEPEEE